MNAKNPDAGVTDAAKETTTKTSPRADAKKIYPPGQTGDGEQKTIVFLRTRQYECFGRRKGPTFIAGKEYTFDAEFADRWLRRNAAYDVRFGPPEQQPDEDEVIAGGSASRDNDYIPARRQTI
jgi:hypothetical protein